VELQTHEHANALYRETIEVDTNNADALLPIWVTVTPNAS
jgi:hypothetical protein